MVPKCRCLALAISSQGVELGGSLMHPDEMGHCTKIVMSTLSVTVAARLVPERIRAKFRTLCLHSRHIGHMGSAIAVAILFVAPCSLYNHAHHTRKPLSIQRAEPHLLISHPQTTPTTTNFHRFLSLLLSRMWLCYEFKRIVPAPFLDPRRRFRRFSPGTPRP